MLDRKRLRKKAFGFGGETGVDLAIRRSTDATIEPPIDRNMCGEYLTDLGRSGTVQLDMKTTYTALRDIQALLALGVLIKNEGGGRSVNYRMSDGPGS